MNYLPMRERRKKLAHVVLATFLLVLGIPITAQADYTISGCNERIISTTRGEDKARNEADAGDYASAFLDFQQAAIYRANCADETSGLATQWNRFYEALDYFSMSAWGGHTELWKDQSAEYHAKAHSLANNLLGESLTSDLRPLVQKLWEFTKNG
jgi:hypothetical protein